MHLHQTGESVKATIASIPDPTCLSADLHSVRYALRSLVHVNQHFIQIVSPCVKLPLQATTQCKITATLCDTAFSPAN